MKGFSLIELMIVLAILALLASVAAPLAEVTVQRNKEQDLRQALRELRGAIDAYKRAGDEGRIERAPDATGYPPTLAVLVDGVKDKSKNDDSKIYFLRRLPADPIGAQDWGLRSYASLPTDPKPGKDVFDVFSQSEQVGLNGRPYKEW